MTAPTSVPETISLILVLITLPGSVWFIWLYAFDGWHRTWFGRSLMAIAVAVLISCVGGILFRFYGLHYPMREWVSVAIWALACFGMWTRALVLVAAQRRDRNGLRAGRH